MSDKIELTEEQAREMLGCVYKKHVFKSENGYLKFDRFELIETWIQHGYIKQNPVEKAEEAIRWIKLNCPDLIGMHRADDIIEGFEYLKKQLEEK